MRCLKSLKSFPFFVFSPMILQFLMISSSGADPCPRTNQEGRPSIGLVLGGGGARGGAHVGVLRFLEEQRVPVDMIAGTSMGAIIGGLYASGMTADEIESILLDTPWSELFTDATPRGDRTLRRKRDDELNLHGPRLGLGENSALLPSGAVAGQKIGLLFEKLVSERTRSGDFDALPIPFRAVSADLVTGDMILLDSGQISLAMRASMSVPGAFDPIRYEGKLLVDGGIVNNLPVDIVRDMGADMVIAVDVSTPEASADELENLLAVVGQLTTLMVSKNTEQQLASLGQEDILLKPELGSEFNSANFAEISKTLPLGYDSAQGQETRLQAVSVSPAEYASWRQAVTGCTSPAPIIHFVRLKNRSRFSDEVIQAKLNVRPGQPLDYLQIEQDMALIYGLGFIRQARYRVLEENGATGIVIEVEQDSRGADFIETGIALSGDGRGSNLDLRAAYLKTDINNRGAEFRGAIQLGTEFGIDADLYMPLDDALRWIAQPGLFASRRELLLFNENGHPIFEFDIEEVGGELAVGREFGRHAGIFAGINRYGGEVSVNIGPPEIGSYRFDGGEFIVRGIFDRLDDLYMPSSGAYLQLEYARSLEALGADEEFEQVRAHAFGAWSRGPHTFWAGSIFNSTLDDDAPTYGLFTGGGFLNMSGYERNELIGQHFGFSLLGYRYRLGEDGLLPGYVGTTIEYGNAAQVARDVYREGILNGSIYLGYNSPIGPLYIGYGWNEEQSGVIFLRLGSILGAQAIGGR